MISEIIKTQIEVALARAGFDLSREAISSSLAKWDIELTKDFSHGDYASNVALLIANGKSEMVNGKSSKEIAEKLLPHLGTDPDGYIEKVEIASPGFLNFFLTDKYLGNVLDEIAEKKDKFGWNDKLLGKKVMVE